MALLGRWSVDVDDIIPIRAWEDVLGLPGALIRAIFGAEPDSSLNIDEETWSCAMVALDGGG